MGKWSNAYKEGLKAKYLETRTKEVLEMGCGWQHGRGAVYTAKDIFNLKDMAEHDAWPDGRFSDEECCIWGAFHREES